MQRCGEKTAPPSNSKSPAGTVVCWDHKFTVISLDYMHTLLFSKSLALATCFLSVLKHTVVRPLMKKAELDDN